MRDSEFELIRRLVYERSRINLSPDKRQLVSARLGRRLRATNVPDVGEYCRLLREPGAERELPHLIDAISTNHTYFFRETAHFDFLRDHAVPDLLERLRGERSPLLRVWSAGCSSGEEPYSIALTLAECLPPWQWQVEASDISHRVLAHAAAGIYPEETMKRVPPETIRAHFQRGFGGQAGYFRVKPAIRDRVAFHHGSLLEPRPPFAGPCQVIFCRNVMIYFDGPTQAELVTRLTRRLAPGGYLMVGHSECLSHLPHSLQAVRPAVYQKPFTS